MLKKGRESFTKVIGVKKGSYVSDVYLKGIEKDYIASVRAAVKNQLYFKSPLRNKFQVRPVDYGEIISYECKKSYVINGKAVVVSHKSTVSGSLAAIIQIDCTVKIPEKDFVGKKLKENIDLIVSKVDILEKEKKIYKDIRKYKGKGVFSILTDVQVFVAKDSKKNLINFYVVEQVGVAVLQF